MAMSEEEKQKYLIEIEGHINAVADQFFLKRDGRTWRQDEVVPRPAPITHAEKNGDSSHQPDTWQKIKRDFPTLFGESTDA